MTLFVPLRIEELFMKSNQRRLERLQIQNNIFATIYGNLEESTVPVIDMNLNGLSCYINSDRNMEQIPVMLDLTTKQNQTIINALPASIVFNNVTLLSREDMVAAGGRCGIKFDNLSSLQKKLLQLVIKNYVSP